MKALSSLLASLLIASVISIATTAQDGVKQFEQKDHLFRMSPPAGWRWNEQPGAIKISDPRTGNAISIQFGPAAKYSNEAASESLKKVNQMMIERFVKPSGGTVIKEEERRLGGIYARQLIFLQSHNGQTGTVTFISLFNKEHAFTVTFGGPDKAQLSEMQKSVETLRFQ